MDKKVPEALESAFSSVKVIPVDMVAFHAKVNGLLKEYLDDDEKAEARAAFAIFVAKDGTTKLMDTDCVEIGLEVELFRHGPGFAGIMSEFKFLVKSLDDLPQKQPVSVKEFMGSRYGYNSRVLSNMWAWLPVLSK